jgi:tetratricopeptide (TPR) repeat protein
MSENNARPAPPADNLSYAADLVRAGHKVQALEVLRRAVAARPNHQAAWLWLSAVSPDRAEAEAALAQARLVNPAHPRLVQAEEWLAHRFPAEPPGRSAPLVATAASAPAPVSVEPAASTGLSETPGRKLPAFPAALKQSRLFKPVMAGLVVLAVAGIGSLVMLLSLGFGINATARAQPDGSGREQAENGTNVETALADPDSALNQAWKERDWARAVTILEKFYGSQPASAGLAERLAHAYIQQGIALRHKGFIEKALLYFEQALVVAPQEPHARREFRLAASYMEGIHLYQAGQWPKVIETLQPVWREDSDYVNVHDLLYSA